MPFNTRKLLTDQIGQPVPQYYNPANDLYETVQGSGGSTQVIVAANKMEYYGKSTDAKPSGVVIGSTFFEIDTTNAYMYDGSTWVEI